MLTFPERTTLEQVLSGREIAQAKAVGSDARLLVTQKDAAKALSVSRVTIWRMTKDCVLHPVEILPGTWRYPWHEIASLAQPASAASSCIE